MMNSGLMFIDCHGTLIIHNSTFSENDYKEQQFNTSFAGGLHMEFSGIANYIIGTTISITSSIFERNRSPKYCKFDPRAVTRQINLSGYSLGGGLGIVFM